MGLICLGTASTEVFSGLRFCRVNQEKEHNFFSQKKANKSCIQGNDEAESRERRQLFHMLLRGTGKQGLTCP